MMRASVACVRHLICLDRMWWDWHGQIDSVLLFLSVHIVHHHHERFQRIMQYDGGLRTCHDVQCMMMSVFSYRVNDVLLSFKSC